MGSVKRYGAILVGASAAAVALYMMLSPRRPSEKEPMPAPSSSPSVAATASKPGEVSTIIDGRKVTFSAKFPRTTAPDAGAPYERPPPQTPPSGDEQCRLHRADLELLAEESALNSKVDPDPDLHYRAARLYDLERKLHVQELTLGSLEKLRNLKGAPEFGDPEALDGRLVMERKALEEVRAKMAAERDEAARRGQTVLVEPEGATKVIVALLWKQVATETRNLQRACEDPQSPVRVNVEPFLAGTKLMLDDLEGGHGVGPRTVVEQLLREERSKK